METGLYKKQFYLRDLVLCKNDLQFTYALLLDRLSNKNTLIKYITNNSPPSYDEHVKNLKNKFKILKICMINDIHVGFMPIDNNNFFGMFYSSLQLKKSAKKYNLDLKAFDISKHYLELLKKEVKKGECLFAYINPGNYLSTTCCTKSFEHIANLYGYKNE